MKAKLIVALDYSRMHTALSLLDELDELVDFYKVGLELFLASGTAILDELRERKKKIFLDLKLHDISNTVLRAFELIAAHNIDITTVHIAVGRDCLEQLQRLRTAEQVQTQVFGITALTNLDKQDISQLYNRTTVMEQVLSFGKTAYETGLDGVVCSAHEIKSLRKIHGRKLKLLCPGIRLADSARNDQKRVASPASAAEADYIVVGRTITTAKNRRKSTVDVLRNLGEELA